MEKNFKKVKGDVNKLRKAKIKVEILYIFKENTSSLIVDSIYLIFQEFFIEYFYRKIKKR